MPIVVATPSSLNTGTCTPWATAADVDVPTGVTFDAALLAECLQAASDVLFELSGRRYPGLCTDTVRPCAQPPPRDHGRPFRGVGFGIDGYFPGPWLAGAYSTFGFCGCGSERSGCNTVPEITLGVYPVDSVSQVLVDGAVVDPSEYRVDDNRWLVGLTNPATGVTRTWNCCQPMTLPTTAVGTFAVTVAYGSMPPTLGKLAAAELAGQLSLAAKPSQGGTCQLPQRVTQITRQGVTAVVLDPLSLMRDGLIGLPLCDRFLMSQPSPGLRRRSVISSPDISRRVRRTTG